MPTPVLVDPQQNVTPKPRYQRIYEEFGEISKQSLVCAMHMHVDVADDEEGVAVIDRIRPWLPVLLAISANSPFWAGGGHRLRELARADLDTLAEQRVVGGVR